MFPYPDVSVQTLQLRQCLTATAAYGGMLLIVTDGGVIYPAPLAFLPVSRLYGDEQPVDFFALIGVGRHIGFLGKLHRRDDKQRPQYVLVRFEQMLRFF